MLSLLRKGTLLSSPGSSSLVPDRSSGAATFQGERRPRDDEAERADGEGHRVAHENTAGGRDGWSPPQGEVETRLPRSAFGGHERAEYNSRERQEE